MEMEHSQACAASGREKCLSKSFLIVFFSVYKAFALVFFTILMHLCSASASRFAGTGNEVIGIDLGTTNSCVAVMEGKVGALCAFIST